jgi:predicted RNA binding protein YcfA (HicA-like mRNA interferase family)
LKEAAVVNAFKLHQRLLSDPSGIISFRDFERLLKAFGFRHERTTGSHRHYVHPLVSHVLSVQPDGKDAKRYQVRRLLGIVAEYDLSIEE